MDSQPHIIMANKFQSVLDADHLNDRGKAIGFSKRHRLITPFRLALSIMASMASKEVETLADLHRHFNDFWQLQSSYKAFYNQLLKPASEELFRASLSHIMSTLTMKVLGFEAGTAFSEFKRIIIQDGSSFAIHKALAKVFPGRFNAVKPAAVELHCTMDLLQDAPISISLSPDTDSERDYLPEPASLRGDLLLSDRGYLDLIYLRDVDRHGGCFIFRGKEGLNPRVITAFREDGKPIKASQDRDLKAVVSKLPKQQRAELEVEWLIEGEPFRLRLIVSWNPTTKSFCYLLTNLPQDRYTIEMVCLAYKLRWQVEIYQSCNLRRTLFWQKMHIFDFLRLQSVKILDNELEMFSLYSMTLSLDSLWPSSDSRNGSCETLSSIDCAKDCAKPKLCYTVRSWLGASMLSSSNAAYPRSRAGLSLQAPSRPIPPPAGACSKLSVPGAGRATAAAHRCQPKLTI